MFLDRNFKVPISLFSYYKTLKCVLTFIKHTSYNTFVDIFYQSFLKTKEWRMIHSLYALAPFKNLVFQYALEDIELILIS